MPFPLWNDNEVDLLRKIAENSNSFAAGSVASIIAGSGITITPVGGTGAVTISSSLSGTGVAGPATATDNAAVRFDTATGKLVQNSAVLIGDFASNNVIVSGIDSNTDLTLRGGLTGATIVLGRAATGPITLSAANSGAVISLGQGVSGIVTMTAPYGIIGKTGSGLGGNWRYVNDAGTPQWLTGILGTAGATSYSLYDIVNAGPRLTITSGAVGAAIVTINATTPATTTTSGAFQVAGGVGIVGATYIGGLLGVTGTGSFGGTLTATAFNSSGAAHAWTGSSVGFELGAVGSSNTPFLDFHSSANSNDYDSRILASGGAASTGLGTLTFTAASCVLTGTITTTGGATFHTTSTALTNGAGVAAGTLATAPSVGNPTKWIGINDNGTVRYIPAW